MRVRKERIFFRNFIERPYKDKENTIRKYKSLSPFAFFHMSDQVLNTYIALGIMGTVLIGAVLLEKYLVQNEHILAAKFVSGSIYYGMRIGGVCLIGYVFVRIVSMF
ncbi:hypothetical protein COJ27_30065 [Bacillus cereus]|uniref:hypothetical protein n=1 Tax=Bacillus cereus TaxID=1396 RepID=UPI000BF7B373|nr:hypothetical protein [Bacillus cereus]PFL57239.1 hypothetical protein COJ27_30065 [Bacillus cereus]